MRNFWKSLLAVAVLAFASPADAVVNRSTINPGIPAQSAPISSLPLRQNFTAAYNDVNNIYSIINNYGSIVSQNANAVAITGGTINGTTIGNAFPAPGTFSTLTTTAVGSFGSINVTGTAAPLNGLYLEDGFQIPTMTANGDDVVHFVGVGGNAVDFVEIQPGIAANPGLVQVGANGTDTNISLAFYTKGTGVVQSPNINFTGTTVPANGWYRPGSNTLGWSTNSSAGGIIDASDRMVFNDTTQRTIASSNFPTLQLHGNLASGGDDASIALQEWSTTNTPHLYLATANSATKGTNTAVTSSQALGDINFSGADGTKLTASAQIQGLANGTVSSGVVPGQMILSTANSSGVMTAAEEIDSSQNVIFGNTSVAAIGGITPQFQHVIANNNLNSFAAWNGGASEILMSRSAGATIGTHGAVSTGQLVGILEALGDDGTTFKDLADIRYIVQGTVSSGIVPGEMTFGTTNTSGTLTTALTIDNTQVATFANGIVAPSFSPTQGFGSIPSTANGLWLPGANQPGLIAHGAPVITASASGASAINHLVVIAGTTGNPITISPDSGISGDSNETIKFQAAGSGSIDVEAPLYSQIVSSTPAGAFQVGQTGTTGTLRHVINGTGSYFGIYSSGNSLFYSIAVQCPGPGGTSALCGYFNGLAISGSSNNTGNNIFGVLTSTQTGAGVGNTAFTINDQNGVSTFNNVIDDGHGGQKIVAEGSGGGTKFTVTGCSAASTVGGPTAGQFASGSTSTCTFVITMNGATGYTATNGWSCFASDITHALDLTQSATSATTCSVTGAVTSGDTIIFQAKFY